MEKNTYEECAIISTDEYADLIEYKLSQQELLEENQKLKAFRNNIQRKAMKKDCYEHDWYFEKPIDVLTDFQSGFFPINLETMIEYEISLKKAIDYIAEYQSGYFERQEKYKKFKEEAIIKVDEKGSEE